MIFDKEKVREIVLQEYPLKNQFSSTKLKKIRLMKYWKIVREREPLKYKARKMVSSAVRSGKLKKQDCSCGNPNSEAHHPDYNKPLEVIWLCRLCHHFLHSQLKLNKKCDIIINDHNAVVI